MASRVRASRERTPPVSEQYAPVVGAEWPSSLAETCRRNEKDFVEDGPPSTLTACEAVFFTTINWGMRHDNEDRPVIYRDIWRPRQLEFYMIGVLDGHDTADASDFIAKEMPKNLSQRLKDGHPFETAYIQSMEDLEHLLTDHLKDKTKSAGTCVLNCVMAGRYVWCGNLGDCRAALIHLVPPSAEPMKNTGVQRITSLTWLSQDHKASLPWERDRIREAGGNVIDGRIEGLEPSRTLGDADVKQHVKKNVISVVPEVRRAQIGNGTSPAQAVLVCATDGVWDVLSGQDICNLVSARTGLENLQGLHLHALCGNGPPPTIDNKKILNVLAEDFVQFSIAKGSRDDCTAAVALLTVAPDR